MRVPVQIISFSCFLFSVTVVRSQVIRCEVPRDQHVYNPHSYFSGDMTLGAKKPYYCFYEGEYKKGVATCTRDGWTPKPLCAVIRCEVPRDQHVVNPHSYFSGDMTLGAKKPYYCLDGSEYKRGEATCTRDGWTPKPLCAGKMCAAPNIPNAEIVGDQRPEYNIESRIQYKCRRGFEPEQPVEITCNSQTEWTGIRQCTAKQKCPALSVENGLIHTPSSNEEETFYSCHTGYKPFSGNWWDSVTCSGGSWSEEPRCIREEECGAFPSVHHGKLQQTKQIFKDGETTTFECDPGFKPTQRFIRCVSGTWETPVCEVDGRCDIPPKVENAFITSKPKEFYGDGSSVTYVCRSSFLMNGKSTVFCRSGTWEEAPTCKEVMCVANLRVNMRSDVTADGPEVSVRSGRTITLTCLGKGVKLQGQKKITCQSNGEWSSPFPKCEDKTTDEVMCVAMLTENMRSDVTDDEHPGPEISVRSGHTITLSCVGTGVKLQGDKKISCLSNGQWNVPFPKCIRGAMCPLNPTDEDLIMKRSPDIEHPVKHGDKLMFSCREGLTLKGQREITCLPNGEWSSSFPTCKAENTDDQPDNNGKKE